MIVKQIWTANSYRNFNYLIACPETGEALAVDPLDHEKCLQRGQGRGLEHHADPQHARAPRPHRRQRRRWSQKTGAKILAHKNAKDKIADMSPRPRAPAT